jgi:cytochrome oxidase Cu insertion factor (SCO1/SenC/PrrC family)
VPRKLFVPRGFALRSTTLLGILALDAHLNRTRMRTSMSSVALAALLCLVGSAATAQQAAPAPAATPAPEVGTLAPDFALPGATRYGTLKDPVRLSDFRGKTVVLAFFYKARTKG